jgi:hypothetical protein
MNAQIVAAFTLTLRVACQKPDRRSGDQEVFSVGVTLSMRASRVARQKKKRPPDLLISCSLLARGAQRDSKRQDVS